MHAHRRLNGLPSKKIKLSSASFLPLTLRSDPEEERSRKLPGSTTTSLDRDAPPHHASQATSPSSVPPTSQSNSGNPPVVIGRRQSGPELVSEDSLAIDDRPIALRKGVRQLKRVGNYLPEPLRANPSTRLRFDEERNPYSLHQAFRALPKPSYHEGPSNSFGLRRRYYNIDMPSHDPEEHLDLQDMYDSVFHTDHGSSVAKGFGPFPNLSSFELGEWYINAGSELSVKSLQKLVEIARTPGFSESIEKANWARILSFLGANKEELRQVYDLREDSDKVILKDDGQWIDDDGWKKTPIIIPVPVKGRTEDKAVGTLYHRSILSIVHEKIANSADARLFHHEPFELIWQPDASTPPTRVHSDLYNSDTFLKAHRDLQDSLRPPGCTRPRVVVGLMIWSDATQVTSFSDDKLWPCYMAFANESKYRRCKPNSDLIHHIAYFDSLSGDFKDYVCKRGNGSFPPDPFGPVCNNVMMHAQWKIILDEELLDAMKKGIVIMCHDGIERRFYIRIFTVSADYQEKVMVATLRNLGDHPCTRCLVKKSELDQMGTPGDMFRRSETAQKDDNARRALVEQARQIITPSDGAKGLAVGSAPVEALLKPMSLHPAENAFSRVSDVDCNFNIFTALAVDVLHEFEIGVWKGLFIHLLRIVDACTPAQYLCHELDKRYRLVPSFGRSIRRFSANVSKMTRKTARDYEDLLQCALPVFDSLLFDLEIRPFVLSIIAVCAQWHALAKLRMHTDETLEILRDTTIQLGDQLRHFAYDVCSKIPTRELAAEQLRRERREQKAAEKRAEKARKDAERAQKKAEKEAEKAAEKAAKGAERAAKRAAKDAENIAKSVAKDAGNTAKKTSRTSQNQVRASQKYGDGSLNEFTKWGGNRHGKSVEQAAESEPTSKVAEPPSPATLTALHPLDSSSSRTVQGSLPHQDPKLRSDVSGQTAVIDPSRPMSAHDIPREGAPAPSAETPSLVGHNSSQNGKRKLVKLSLHTVKFHFLGDYVQSIRSFGTTDNYSTELGELHHRSPKRWYRRSAKVNFRPQVIRHERKVARMRKLRRRLDAVESDKARSLEEQKAGSMAADIHHYIARDQNAPVDLSRFSRGGVESDEGRDPLGKVWLELRHRFFGMTPADILDFLKEFAGKLHEHLLPRIVAYAQSKHSELVDGEDDCRMFTNLSAFDSTLVSCKGNRIFSHKIMRLKYTTYDVRRREDVLHVDSDVCNIMIPNPEFVDDQNEPPYLHARLLGIYHANVSYMGEIAPGIRHLPPTRLEFLWVRWYSSSVPVEGVPLECVSFLPIHSPDATSFIDPDTVLRAAHLIPRFYSKQVYKDGQGISAMARDGSDWRQYFVNRYADRDMFMRYNIGMAVGHNGIWPAFRTNAIQVYPHLKPPPTSSIPASSVAYEEGLQSATNTGSETRLAEGELEEGESEEESDSDSDSDMEYQWENDPGQRYGGEGMDVNDIAAEEYQRNVEMYGF